MATPASKQKRSYLANTDIYASEDHLAALIERYAKVANAVRATIDETDVRSRSAFVMTDTDDRLIASAAIIGDSNKPVSGYNTPAAIGTPSAL
jgi:hypothetical protein